VPAVVDRGVAEPHEPGEDLPCLGTVTAAMLRRPAGLTQRSM
jgi:hypothetical protein